MSSPLFARNRAAAAYDVVGSLAACRNVAERARFRAIATSRLHSACSIPLGDWFPTRARVKHVMRATRVTQQFPDGRNI
eukprot:3344399-Pyramimonas_sp.AAC.1